ncbi:MAG: hypothetical protein A3H50_01265 [Candidatus Levybacteria bacterium RIFCSPLOWO2_02_FULL_37_10]|nr:MAG: hypothetical protein A2860_01290 [Candidatus Levybacteria bacterium RIFCSPHIGHO2_01_FULL_37_33]OGH16419.1 MAG: hypothetical protein A3C97_02805 [Candidatus Levybacteria bacterium RIFCSPHIGHO2_02_FULL_37_11]OGH29713.1 MAG: hypothetical protein A3F30_03750 [Candidatus Levybacteria bacterium RIFCSPHIGHO2_12_FULL_37_12]OGH32687.1 MAG: hypothetical protein A2953_00650 [Candidatus Levybacteria bacterium RIFCSPLOWO2_01_FULL_36_54]OGH44202.1 MAG: hypothetical protein A3H50_01265 [Candidatus Lev
MNPKAANLDPNLRQAYDRVMGTVTPQPAASSPAQVPTDTPKSQTQVVTAKKRGGFSPVLLVVAIFLFFVIYTVIWVMVFKLKIPFLPFLPSL